MGLYLAVFDGDEEVEGVEVGSYGDFAAFRDAVAQHLEAGEPGSRYPTLMLHSDSEGAWSPAEAASLQRELHEIADAFSRLPPVALKPTSWQSEVARVFGIEPRNLYECFFDVDGEPLIERLLGLAQVSQRHAREILFQ